MKKIAKYFAMIAMVAGGLLMGACHGQPDEEPATDPTTEVPDGVLRIFADKTEIMANGSDLVTFTIMFGKEDVSTYRTLQLVRTIEGVETRMPYGANSFSTVVPGEYTFSAEYYNDGRHYSDNTVTIVVAPTAAGGDQQNYVQHTLGLQFTSVGCPSCPTLGDNIKAVQNSFPGRLIPVSFHQDFEMTDPMTHSSTATYYKLIKAQGLPQFNANLIIDNDYMTISDYTKIVEILDRVEENYPATCGVAIESSMVVGGDNAVKVKVKVTSNTPSAYRYQVFLLEDGISEYQAGASMDYLHNNVVRATASDSAYGDRLNEGVAFQVGVEVAVEKTIAIPSACNLENMRIVAVALNSYDGGNSYVMNNCAVCPLGESIDYDIE